MNDPKLAEQEAEDFDQEVGFAGEDGFSDEGDERGEDAFLDMEMEDRISGFSGFGPDCPD